MLKLNIMKQRYTTPALKKIVTKSILVATAVLLVSAAPFSAVPKAHADQYDDKINALQQQVSQYKAQASALQTKIGTLQDAGAGLQAQQNAIQTQIDLNQIKMDQLNQQIADTTKKISDNKDALGTTLADMYVDNTISPLEMLASAKNIGDYVDKQSYRSSVGDKLHQTITQINDLKASLVKDKTAVEAVLADQQVQKDSLAASQAQQQTILNETRGEEASYQQLVAASQQQLEGVAAQQRAYYQSLIASSGGGGAGVVGSFQYTNWSGNMGCSGGYPYCGPHDSSTDPWSLYNRECVSYVAWALESRFGKSVGRFNGEGNAWEWAQAHQKPNGDWNPVGSAISYSGAVRVSSPQPGDAVILPQSGSFAPIGHAMIVESVNGDWMHVSQYNFYGTGEYSTMDIKNSGIVLLRFHS